jgi:hypothetical protein
MHPPPSLDYPHYTSVCHQQDTLVYGSDDGGKNVHNKREEVANYLALVGEALNLKPHKISRTDVQLSFPVCESVCV